MAKQVLQDESATTADIFHAVKLAKFIGTKKKDKALAIWNDFEKLSNTKIKGGIDEKDFNTAMEELSKLMGITTKTSLKEARESIGRFEGKNQFTNQVFLEILKAIVDETKSQGKNLIEIDFKNNPYIDMIEKMDSNFSHFGIDRSGKFFMESSNIGPVYEQTVEQKFGFNEDLSESFKYLNNNKKIQNSLKKIFKSVGAFRYDAEMFPILTHQGNEKNEVIFVATKYRKEKFGTAGAFVVFKSWLSKLRMV